MVNTFDSAISTFWAHSFELCHSIQIYRQSNSNNNFTINPALRRDRSTNCSLSSLPCPASSAPSCSCHCVRLALHFMRISSTPLSGDAGPYICSQHHHAASALDCAAINTAELAIQRCHHLRASTAVRQSPAAAARKVARGGLCFQRSGWLACAICTRRWVPLYTP